ncbi:MAG: 4-hydroxy-3-methylbut-2-enyl diphosphate reductase [Candidatus Margulisbacteria bacterium]|nr:4-hydroxy-3-methylbut-2-enyl diphosphate reductase [Candidatus Margulisiibacteriota bacterium]
MTPKEIKKILLAKPRGFCFGVEKALEIVNNALSKYKQQIYVFNEIVHNKTIVNDLKNKGVIFTQDPREVKEGSVLIFSAHGVSPKIREYFQGKNVAILDATCPLVAQVHKKAIRYAKEGFHIIYIGHKNHEEAQGVIGEVPNNISVVEILSDIKNIQASQNKYIVLTQTTLNVFEIENIFQKIKEAIPHVVFPDKKDLCQATTARQQAVKALAKKCDTFLILGSQNSSNSRRLKEVAKAAGPKAYLIDSFKDINSAWLKNTKVLGISSGASAPEYLVEETISCLINNYSFEL